MESTLYQPARQTLPHVIRLIHLSAKSGRIVNITMITNATFFTLETPEGPFGVITAAADGSRQVLASGWSIDPEALLGQIHPSLRPTVDLTRGPKTASTEIVEAVNSYYRGDLGAIRHVPVLQHSGPFQLQAWKVLRDVPAGHPITYSDYAQLVGNPQAVRAAARACALNAAALFVPCHRVVRLDGGLGGYRWGPPVKESLLRRERELARPPDQAPVLDSHRGYPHR